MTDANMKGVGDATTTRVAPASQSPPGPPSADEIVRNMMDPGRGTALRRRLAHHLDLTGQEENVLAELTGPRLIVSARETVRYRDDPVDLLVLLSGAMVEQTLDPEGRVQVDEFLLPGDIVGIRSLRLTRYCCDVRAATHCTLASLAREGVRALEGTRLGRLFDALAAAAHQRTLDRLRLVGRARADERLMHLFLELSTRQRAIMPALGPRLWCPFPQSDLGDAVGLTNVYVSKTMTRLKERGAITERHNVVTIDNPGHWSEYVDHEDRAAMIDLDHVRAAP